MAKWCLGYAPRFLLHAANLRHGTDNFTSLPKEGVLRNFLSPFKNPTASAGFEPANLGIRGPHATSAPPKPLVEGLTPTQSARFVFQTPPSTFLHLEQLMVVDRNVMYPDHTTTVRSTVVTVSAVECHPASLNSRHSHTRSPTTSNPG